MRLDLFPCRLAISRVTLNMKKDMRTQMRERTIKLVQKFCSQKILKVDMMTQKDEEKSEIDEESQK